VTRCIVILSDKSSGSTALQAWLVRSAGARHLERTRHAEHETLYWTKAASWLGLPQVQMLESEVPIAPAPARADLEALLRDNGAADDPAVDDPRAWVFAGWRALCARHAPLFVEKSPHHLHQWSALELLRACLEASPEIPHLVIGLVRNPLDTLHSSWRRWGADPETHQHEWLRAYRNLERLRPLLGERMALIRYEDIVRDPSRLDFVHRFTGAQAAPADGLLHARSVGRAAGDPSFRFALAEPVRELARAYGYRDDELEPRPGGRWRRAAASLYGKLRRRAARLSRAS
jgi:hypothetical protein